MDTEIEGKWLDTDHEKLRKRLRSAGATCVQQNRRMKRKNFDYPDRKLEKTGGWVRVRDEGDKITLSYKQLLDRTVLGTKEVSVIVSSFEDTCQFLESIGMQMASYQETERESWVLDEVQIELDTWPWIPTFAEIETDSVDLLQATAIKLGLSLDDALHGSVETAYQAVYDVTESEVNNMQVITFEPVPEWLQKRRITNFS